MNVQTRKSRNPVRWLWQWVFVWLWSAFGLAHAQFNYVTNNGALTITGYSGGPGSVAIPESINGLSVSAIAPSAFETNSDVTEVAIPKTVLAIGAAAFASCTSLTALDVDPQNPAYKTVDGVLYNFDGNVLLQCPAGKRGGFVVPDAVTDIGIKAFAFCFGLTNITLPNGVIMIEDHAFANCSGLTSFVIPFGVTSISAATFSSCSHMVTVTIPNTVTNIGDYAFTFCGLTSVTLPEGVQTIGNVCFGNCSKLTRVSIPKSVTSIGVYAFSACTALQELYFTGNCPTFGSDAFSNATQAKVYFAPGTTGWDSFSARPAVLWNATIASADPTFGVSNNQFGFPISGSDGLTIVVEMSPTLDNPTWSPVLTNTLSGGSAFRDARPLDSSGFYRLRSP